MKGISITLYQRTQTDNDEFNRPIYTEEAVNVDNVLIAPASTTEILDTLNLTGKKAVYNLAIPKGDTHDWVDAKVEFFGETWKTISFPQEGIEANIPTRWHKKVQVERYE
jgi:hypothetical protein